MASEPGVRAAKITALLLGVLAVYWLADIVWRLIPQPAPEQEVVAAAPAPLPRNAGPAVDARQIAGWHLFGQAEQLQAVKAVPIDAPETRLSLTLRGVVATDNTELARAIIAEQNRDERSYRIGDNLPGGAELMEIHADRVILRRAGRYETLRLPKQPLSGNEAVVSKTSGSAPSSEALTILADYRTVIKDNPRALIDLVRPVPYQEQGRFGGFRLYPGNKAQYFSQFGLRPGDLVTEVNGIVLDSAAKGVEVLSKLRDAPELNLHIRRGRQEIDLNFSLTAGSS